MGDLITRINGLVLSATEVAQMTGWPPAMVEDYLNILRNIIEITDEVDNGSLDIADIKQLISDNSAAISKLHSRANKAVDAIGDNTDLIAGNTELINQLYSINSASISKLTSRINNTFKVFDEQIGLRETAATGLVSDGTVFPATATTIDVNAGTGEIVDGYTDRRNPTRINVAWPDTFGFAVSMPDPIGLTVIFVDATEVVQQQPAPITATQRRNAVQLGFVYYKDGAIEEVIQAGILSNEVGNTLYDWMFFTPSSDRVQGMGVNPVSGQLQIWGDAGTLISPGSNVTASITNPNIFTLTAIGSTSVAEPFDVLFADGSTYLLAQTNIPKFYESAPGVATALSGQDAVIHYVYRPFSNEFYLQLGSKTYPGGKEARDSLDIDRAGYTAFVGANTTLLSAQVYADRTSSDFADSTKAGIVSLIGDGAGSSGGISVSSFLPLQDVLETTYLAQKLKVVTVNSSETGLVFSEDLQQQMVSW